MFAWVLALQTAVNSAPIAPLGDVHFDLRDAPPPVAGESAIVVRALRLDPRLKPLPFTAETPVLPRAEFKLFGKTTLSTDFAPTTFANGTVSNRMMVTMKLHF